MLICQRHFSYQYTERGEERQMAENAIQLKFENYSDKTYSLVDSDGVIIQTFEPTKKIKVNDKIKRLENSNLFKEYIKESFGDFFFNYYKKSVGNEYLFRFMYLCTFMNYKNYIEFGNAKGENKLAKKKDIKEILNLQKTAFNDTYNYFIKNKMIVEDEEGYILVNDKFCNKGKIRRIDYIRRNGSVRMFEDGIKELYEKATAKEHNQLGLLVKLLPYIHFDMNIVCENPSEDWEDIKPLSLTKLAKLLGYSTTQKLRNAIFDLTVDNESAIMVAKINKVDMIAVNPKIYYKGNNIESLQYLQRLFAIAEKLKK